MPGFIIFSSNEQNLTRYEEIVSRELEKKSRDYQCVCVNNLKDFMYIIDQNDKGNTYILENFDEYRVRKIVNTIRLENRDYNSYIVVIDQKEQLIDLEYSVKNSIVLPRHNIDERLKQIVEEILLEGKCEIKRLNIEEDGIIYKIPYSDILYVEKEANLKYCNIVCKNRIYHIKSTLTEITKKLGSNFIRTHKSAFINLENVKAYDKINNSIIFINNTEFYLISREGKKDLIKSITE